MPPLERSKHYSECEEMTVPLGAAECGVAYEGSSAPLSASAPSGVVESSPGAGGCAGSSP